jgi:hypothetical protein
MIYYDDKMPNPIIDLDGITRSISELVNKMNTIKQDIIDTTEMMDSISKG